MDKPREDHHSLHGICSAIFLQKRIYDTIASLIIGFSHRNLVGSEQPTVRSCTIKETGDNKEIVQNLSNKD